MFLLGPSLWINRPRIIYTEGSSNEGVSGFFNIPTLRNRK